MVELTPIRICNLSNSSDEVSNIGNIDSFEPLLYFYGSNTQMKSITIHNIETTLANQIELLAKRESISQNKLIKRILRKSLGVEEKGKNSNILKFVNTLSNDEVASIFENLKDVSEIDHSEW